MLGAILGDIVGSPYELYVANMWFMVERCSRPCD